MASYTSAVQVYYCKQTESPSSAHRIAPAPMLTISPEIYYANDNPVGYTYSITLTGYANSLRKELNDGSTDYGVEKTVTHIGTIRDIFSFNGGNLYVKDGDTNVIVAKGATIKSIKFDPSDNKWLNYSPFTIEIEFNEVDFTGCESNSSIGCNNSIFHTHSQDVVADNLIDMREYKIKEFSDKWTITIDTQVYDGYSTVFNNVFRVSYTLSATGKHYYVDGTTIPAWQQAKLFCQKRLYKQVTSLLDGILQIDASTSCGASKSIDELHNTDNSGSRDGGIMSGFVGLLEGGGANHNIYNETITCNTSESNGSFSLTYNAIVKKYNPALNPQTNAVLHTFTNNTSTTQQKEQSTSMSIQGSIQGLVRGGFIYQNNDFTLPDSGTFISLVDAAETKYSNALAHYNSQVADGYDLSSTFKNLVGVTAAGLGITATGNLRPSSFSTDHNYTNGVIGYNVTYDSKTASSSSRGYTNISIVRNDPVEIIQEFVVPGRANGPIIQKLGMKTSRTISINIEGAGDLNKECPDGEGGVLEDVCNSLPEFDIPGFEALLAVNEGYVRTREDYTSNKIDGSFSISLEYTCRG